MPALEFIKESIRAAKSPAWKIAALHDVTPGYVSLVARRMQVKLPRAKYGERHKHFPYLKITAPKFAPRPIAEIRADLCEQLEEIEGRFYDQLYRDRRDDPIP